MPCHLLAQKSCGHHAYHEHKFMQHPSFKMDQQMLEAELRQISQALKDIDGDTILIPTVFHIIHNGDPIGNQENISEDLILAQLEQLNNDFQRRNSDTISTPQEFLGVAADTQIKFCLAMEDPTGAQTDGIVRTNINTLQNVDEDDCWTLDYVSNRIVSPTIWNRNFYLNIYTVFRIDEMDSNGCNIFSILGYGQLPGGPASTDAIVVSYFTTGSLDFPNPDVPQYLGRTATHELGHWLNLDHPWGGSLSCGTDDLVDDTPVQESFTVGCPPFPIYDACTTQGDGIMYMNFMDYSSDLCMNIFTEGQKERMRNSIFLSRSSLISSACNFEEILSIEDWNASIQSQNNTVELNWSYTGQQVDKFIIEKADAGLDFKYYDEVEICSSVSEACIYDYIDNRPWLGANYYKIKAIHKQEEKSSSAVLIHNVEELEYSIFPNPSYGELNVRGSLDKLEIYNVLGQKIETLDNSGVYRLEALDPGFYNLYIYNESTVEIFQWLKY